MLGYDVLLDRSLRPWLMEVNHSPSYGVESPLDLGVKRAAIGHALALAVGDPRRLAAARGKERAAAESRLYCAGGAGGTGTGAAPGGVLPTAPAAHCNPPPQQRSQGTSCTPVATAAGTSGSVESGGAAEPLAERFPERYAGYERLYPPPDPRLGPGYARLLQGARELFAGSFHAKVNAGHVLTSRL